MKVAIVGAGICGLYLGWKLSERGEKVVVFERKKMLGKEVCSGLFSERILDFIPESRQLIEKEIDSVLIHFPKKTLTINFSKKFYLMNHARLDKLTAGLAERDGAKIILNHPIEEIPREFDRVIGCDGADSFVRKKLGLPGPKPYLAFQGFTPVPESSREYFSVRVETWPTKSGFIWKIPRVGETEYGIFEKTGEAKKIFEDFLAKKNILLIKRSCAMVPQGLILANNPRITLCGDAAGLCKPWSGGGVVWGLTAANLLLKNFPDFLQYQKELKKFFLSKIIFSKVAKKLVYFLGNNFPQILLKNYTIESDFLL